MDNITTTNYTPEEIEKYENDIKKIKQAKARAYQIEYRKKYKLEHKAKCDLCNRVLSSKLSFIVHRNGKQCVRRQQLNYEEMLLNQNELCKSTEMEKIEA